MARTRMKMDIVGRAKLEDQPTVTEAIARKGSSKPLYARHFGLKRAPFSIAPDPRYLYMSERHREALAHLLYGLKGGGGFVLLTGEIGAGKTTVCRCMLDQVPQRCNVAYIFNPKLSVGELLETVCDEFRIPRVHGNASVKALVDSLNEYLLRTHAVGQTNVLVIDEAQNLSAAVLDQLRLLTNLETNERKLLQIVLVGQPELRDMLAAPGMEQLAQRVIARYHLGALSSSDISQYIRHRLRVSGLRGALPFDREALRRVAHHSRGVARRINLLCDRALLGAYAEGRQRVSRRIVDKAAVEAFGKPALNFKLKLPPWLGAAAAGLGCAALLALLLGLWLRAKPAAAPEAPRPISSRPVAPLAKASAPAAAQGAASTPGSAPAAATPPAHSAPAAAASASARPPALWLQADTLRNTFGRASADEAGAWQMLGRKWGLKLPALQPCREAARLGVPCYRDPNSNLGSIRQLARPGILSLYDSNDKPLYVQLIALSEDSAVLRGADGNDQRVTLASLAPLWRGEFATLWQAPEGYDEKIRDIAAGPAADKLAERLAELARKSPQQAGQPLDANLRTAIAAFQFAQGLKPDGKAGPMTLMQLNRLTGLDEPRLGTEG